MGQNEVVLVKRFDRDVVADGIRRSLFASAATVLRLRSDSAREDPDHSYVQFAHEWRRWCADRNQSYADQQRELWRRMVFNAPVGNYDDHPSQSWTALPFRLLGVVTGLRHRGDTASARRSGDGIDPPRKSYRNARKI
jgi:hypothetical protein